VTKASQMLQNQLNMSGYGAFVPVEELFEILKAGEYFIHAGEIRLLKWAEWNDWEDGSDYYSVQVEDLPEEDEE
jgi:hypothetical protein